VPPGLAKKGVTADEWSRDRRYDDDDDDDRAVYDRGDLPRYAVTPQGRIIDIERRLGDGWSVVEGITTEDGLPAYVIGPDRRIYSIENRLDDGWRLADPEDLVRLPTRNDNREYYLLDDEVVEIINREGEPYVRLIGALNDILN
jgi:hypothetical protein